VEAWNFAMPEAQPGVQSLPVFDRASLLAGDWRGHGCPITGDGLSKRCSRQVPGLAMGWVGFLDPAFVPDPEVLG
jgi:hypothetical protein